MARTKKQELIDNEVQDIQSTEEEVAVEITELIETTEVIEAIKEEEEVKPVVKEKPAKKEISKIEIEEKVPTYNPWWRF